MIADRAQGGRVSGPGPVGGVTAVSTGSVRVHPQHVQGSRLPAPLWILLSRTWTAPRPVHCFIVEHREGLVLFDTGEDPSSVTEPDYFPRGGLAGAGFRHLARFELSSDDGVGSHIRAAGYSPDDVRLVVLSHLHQDHIGGLRDLPRARIIVTAEEWRQIGGPRAQLRGYLAHHIDLPGLAWERIEFSATDESDLLPFTTRHDLFDDGSLVLIPTPGHTKGSLSMVVRSEASPILLVGDLSYDLPLMRSGKVPGIGDRGQLRASSRLILELARRLGTEAILPSHDPGSAVRLRAAQAHAVN